MTAVKVDRRCAKVEYKSLKPYIAITVGRMGIYRLSSTVAPG
jgi:hypothetical protein